MFETDCFIGANSILDNGFVNNTPHTLKIVGCRILAEVRDNALNEWVGSFK